ncbi:MAG: hypothetical protein HC819_14950 [Cyclobacteriaceae bacterium]|nr:hypothetical protein [Cyclobacteriaceae bacterium]
MDYKQTLIKLIKLTAQTRTAQYEYFKRIAHAKKSRTADDFAAAGRALSLSKDLEAELDAFLVSTSKQIDI